MTPLQSGEISERFRSKMYPEVGARFQRKALSLRATHTRVEWTHAFTYLAAGLLLWSPLLWALWLSALWCWCGAQIPLFPFGQQKLPDRRSRGPGDQFRRSSCPVSDGRPYHLHSRCRCQYRYCSHCRFRVRVRGRVHCRAHCRVHWRHCDNRHFRCFRLHRFRCATAPNRADRDNCVPPMLALISPLPAQAPQHQQWSFVMIFFIFLYCLCSLFSLLLFEFLRGFSISCSSYSFLFIYLHFCGFCGALLLSLPWLIHGKNDIKGFQSGFEYLCELRLILLLLLWYRCRSHSSSSSRSRCCRSSKRAKLIALSVWIHRRTSGHIVRLAFQLSAATDWVLIGKQTDWGISGCGWGWECRWGWGRGRRWEWWPEDEGALGDNGAMGYGAHDR